MTKYINIVKKVWGEERWIRNDEMYCIKELVIKPDYQTSIHYHKKKTETFYIVHGIAGIEIFENDGTSKTHIIAIGKGSTRTLHIERGVKHRIIGVTAEETLLLECSTQHFEDDSYRESKSGKRVI